MYDETELDSLIAAMRATGTVSLTVRTGGRKLRLSLPDTHSPAPIPMPMPQPAQRVTSPGIGLFRPRGEEDGLAALAPGDQIGAGDVLGYVAQGPALRIVTSPTAGRLGPALPRTGKICGHGDILFTLETAP